MLKRYLLICLLPYALCTSLKSNEEARILRAESLEFPRGVTGDIGSRVLRGWNDGSRRSLDIYDDKIWRKSRGISGAEKLKAHLAMMGHPNTKCDDGQTDLEIDWDGSPVLHTCYQPKDPFPVDKNIEPFLKCDSIPEGYLPKHVCMNKEIRYETDIPTHEMHRPLWAVFGEYVFVPPQRWLHNVEHGSIVMLYHPCAELAVVNELKAIVKGCIRKHVISADARLPRHLPLVLIGWGCRLLMNSVDVPTVVNFIKDHGLTGPEGQLPQEGQYNLTLVEKSKIPPGSDYRDSKLCPSYS